MNLTPEKRRNLLMGAALGLAIVLSVLWLYGDLSDRRAVAMQATSDAAVCQRLADQIRALQTKPSLAQSHELEHQELTRRIESAAQQAGVPATSLVSIVPESAQRINRTPYKRKPTQVQMTNVTLQQLVGVLGPFAAEQAGPKLTRLMLAAPRGADELTGNRWSADMTLTYLIYAPASSSKSSASPTR